MSVLTLGTTKSGKTLFLNSQRARWREHKDVHARGSHSRSLGRYPG